MEMTKRYDGLAAQSRLISGQQDLVNFAKNTPIAPNLLRIPKKVFAPPQPPQEALEESHEYNVSSKLVLTLKIRIILILYFIMYLH